MNETKNLNPIHEPFNRLRDAANSGDLALTHRIIDEVCAPDMIVRTPLPSPLTGAELQKMVFTTLHAAFPDLHIETEDAITEGDKVVYRNVVTGTHQGTYMGVPATGRKITYNEIFIMRIVDGRIVETWGVVDTAAQMRQLGLIPGDPHAAAPDQH